MLVYLLFCLSVVIISTVQSSTLNVTSNLLRLIADYEIDRNLVRCTVCARPYQALCELSWVERLNSGCRQGQALSTKCVTEVGT